jgi:anaerobic magnesium-protoporphyrin IX monomethyl ester cyclase
MGFNKREEQMKILVINIALRPESKVKEFPIGLGHIMSAMKRNGYDFEFLDINGQRYPEEYVSRYIAKNKFDVVCFGCIVTGYKYVKWLASEIKKANPKTVIIAGNTVASSIPGIILTKTGVDIAVLGEGDVAVVEVLDRLNDSKGLNDVKGIGYKNKEGKVIFSGPRAVIPVLDDIPSIAWDMFDMETYIQGTIPLVSDPCPVPRDELRPFNINTARGCPFRCSFCYHAFYGEKYRFRSPESIVAEIKFLKERYRINYILFDDELTFFSKKQSEETIDCFLKNKLDIFWVASCRSGLFSSDKDVELAKKFQEAGCIGLAYSLESANLEILQMMNKHLVPEDFARQREILERAGLCTWTSLVFGFPIETEETIRQTFDYCIANGIYPSAGYLLPFPGSPMYDYAKKNGFIPDEEEYLLHLGDRQDLRLNMTKMTDQKLQDEVIKGLKRCNERLGLDLKTAELIKTGYYRSKKNIIA